MQWVHAIAVAVAATLFCVAVDHFALVVLPERLARRAAARMVHPAEPVPTVTECPPSPPDRTRRRAA